MYGADKVIKVDRSNTILGEQKLLLFIAARARALNGIEATCFVQTRSALVIISRSMRVSYAGLISPPIEAMRVVPDRSELVIYTKDP